MHDYTATGKYKSENIQGNEFLNEEESDFFNAYGIAQWTGERYEMVSEKYMQIFGENYFPTEEECAELEVDFILEELQGSQQSVIEEMKNSAVSTVEEENVAAMTKVVMEKYEIAGTDTLQQRQGDALTWYDILMNED